MYIVKEPMFIDYEPNKTCNKIEEYFEVDKDDKAGISGFITNKIKDIDEMMTKHNADKFIGYEPINYIISKCLLNNNKYYYLVTANNQVSIIGKVKKEYRDVYHIPPRLCEFIYEVILRGKYRTTDNKAVRTTEETTDVYLSDYEGQYYKLFKNEDGLLMISNGCQSRIVYKE
jgi:hypothetical protein